jgi:hypothetical protein
MQHKNLASCNDAFSFLSFHCTVICFYFRLYFDCPSTFCYNKHPSYEYGSERLASCVLAAESYCSLTDGAFKLEHWNYHVYSLVSVSDSVYDPFRSVHRVIVDLRCDLRYGTTVMDMTSHVYSKSHIHTRKLSSYPKSCVVIDD